MTRPSNNIYKSILVLKNIKEIRSTLTLEEQVIFDKELLKLKTDDGLQNNVAYAAGAVVVVSSAELVALEATKILDACIANNCPEYVETGANNARNNAKTASQTVQDYVVGIFSSVSLNTGNDELNRVLEDEALTKLSGRCKY